MNHAQYNLKSVALYALVLILTYYLTPNVIETVGDGAVVLLFIMAQGGYMCRLMH